MYKNFFLSLFLHLFIIFILISNLNFWQKSKKITYQKFSVKISSIVKNKPPEQNKEILTNTNPSPKITKDIKEKVTTKIQDHGKKERPKKIDENVKKSDAEIKIKLKDNKDTKKIAPKNVKPKKNPKSNIPKTKKPKSNTVKKNINKQNIPKQDIFSQLDITNDSSKLSNTPAELNITDTSLIEEQIKQNWITTPCSPEMIVTITFWIDYDCNIIDSKSTTNSSSPQHKACIDSALNAIHKTNKLHLEAKSCKKYAHKAMITNLSNNNSVR